MRTPQSRQKEGMNRHTKIGLIAGMFLAMSTATAFAQMPGTPYMPAPPTITLAQNQNYMVASIYDADYMPYTVPTAAAAIGAQAADGTAESTVINVQGSIPSTGITVYIPATATGSGTLPAYTSNPITVPADHTEDNQSRDLVLSWAAQPYTRNTIAIVATLNAVGGTLNAKKLDINGGLGNDYMGVSLATLSYPYNKSGNTTTFTVHDIAGIPDKMFGQYDNGSTTMYEHNLIYVPVVGEDGKIWLNNNLGADYANVNSANFNPGQQATAYNDYHAYGSLFQWGRKPDGHEIVVWTSATSGTQKYGYTTIQSDEPADAMSIFGGAYDWRVHPDGTLWDPQTGANNPCPNGFTVPTASEVATYVQASGLKLFGDLIKSGLRFCTPGDNGGDYYATTSNTSHRTSLHTSIPDVSNFCYVFSFTDVDSPMQTYAVRANRWNSKSVRCIGK